MMTKAEARRWIQQHWAALISQSDCPDDCPDKASEIWGEEVWRIADRIAGRKDRHLDPRTPAQGGQTNG